MRALLLVGCLAVVAPLAPAPKRTVARRAALLGFSSAAVLAPAARADLLEAAGKLVTVLKPLYGFEAPLQAGAYDRAAVRARIERDVRSGPVVVYSYTLSPFCTEAKALLAAQGARVTVIELGDGGSGCPACCPRTAPRSAELGAMTGQTSMPHVFIGGASIGGLASGTPGLKALLRDGSLRDKRGGRRRAPTMMMLALVVAACAATPAPSPAPCGAGAYYDDLACAGGDCCRSCPAEGALCDAEATLLSALPLAAGYWRAAADSAELFECARRSHCDGGPTVGAYCAARRALRRCAGDFSRSGDGACARCPRRPAAPGASRRRASSPGCSSPFRSAPAGAARRASAPNRDWRRAKLLLAGAQIVGATTWTLEHWRLPAWFRAVAKALNVLNLDADARRAGCVSGATPAALPWATLAPIAAVGLAALRFWRCESYDGDAFLAADVFVRCDGARYASWRPYAALMVCVYPVGIPVAYFCALFRHRHRLNPRVPPASRTLLLAASTPPGQPRAASRRRAAVVDAARDGLVALDVLAQRKRAGALRFLVDEHARRLPRPAAGAPARGLRVRGLRVAAARGRRGARGARRALALAAPAAAAAAAFRRDGAAPTLLEQAASPSSLCTVADRWCEKFPAMGRRAPSDASVLSGFEVSAHDSDFDYVQARVPRPRDVHRAAEFAVRGVAREPDALRRLLADVVEPGDAPRQPADLADRADRPPSPPRVYDDGDDDDDAPFAGCGASPTSLLRCASPPI
ncbi:hypothetical protein JL720_10407 [Aureococcus anophagefferens]|nr:hypothetical protein JL720_10407 [Aureococcus anophagefferens]